MATVYGPIFHRAQLDRAVIQTLRDWSPHLLAAIEVQEGLEVGSLPRIKSWAAVGDTRNAPELEPPYVLVTSRGTSERPQMDGDGSYSGLFAVAFTVEIEVNSPRQDQANYVVGLYAAALRTALGQQADLGGIASGLQWAGESYDELGVSEADQTARAVAGAAYLVRVDELFNATRGPSELPTDPIPPGDWPLVSDPIVVLSPQPVSEEPA